MSFYHLMLDKTVKPDPGLAGLAFLLTAEKGLVDASGNNVPVVQATGTTAPEIREFRDRPVFYFDKNQNSNSVDVELPLDHPTTIYFSIPAWRAYGYLIDGLYGFYRWAAIMGSGGSFQLYTNNGTPTAPGLALEASVVVTLQINGADSFIQYFYGATTERYALPIGTANNYVQGLTIGSRHSNSEHAGFFLSEMRVYPAAHTNSQIIEIEKYLAFKGKVCEVI